MAAIKGGKTINTARNAAPAGSVSGTNTAWVSFHDQIGDRFASHVPDIVAPTTADDQPYYIAAQRPPAAGELYWQTEIRGPFVAMVHFGTRQECGPAVVKMLNLAYKAGRRKRDA